MFVDWPALTVGLLLGVAVALLLRASQIWRQRRAFGLDVYAAAHQRTWLRRWSLTAFLTTLLFSGLWIYMNVPLSTLVATPIVSPDTSVPTAEPIAGARLVIPKIGVDTHLIEAPIVGREWDISLLRDEVAHLESTAAIGQQGNVVVAGHITIPGGGWGPFRELAQLEVGDRVFVWIGDEVMIYEVTGLETVSSEAVHVVFPTEGYRLTLITCTDWDEEAGTYAQRVVVYAELHEG